MMLFNTITSKITITRLGRVNFIKFILLFSWKQVTEFFFILFHVEIYHSKHVSVHQIRPGCAEKMILEILQI